MLKIRGFDELKFGPKIEVPDVAELLMEPFFFDASVEDVYEYGSDFQKGVLDSIPGLGKNGKNVISVQSQIKFLGPDFLSCTFTDGWHIDSQEASEVPEKFYPLDVETDIVHLLTNKTSSTTLFPSKSFFVEELSEDSTNKDLRDYFLRHPELLEDVSSLPDNQIVTFTNHFHRASNPTKYEFRYVFRVTETDRKRPTYWTPDKVNSSVVMDTNINSYVTSILKNDEHIVINIP